MHTYKHIDNHAAYTYKHDSFVYIIPIPCSSCFPHQDSFHDKAAKGQDVELQQMELAIEHLREARRLFRGESGLHRLEAIAKSRFGLSVAARAIYLKEVAQLGSSTLNEKLARRLIDAAANLADTQGEEGCQWFR